MPADGSVDVADVTSAYACLGLWGPRARDILQPLTKSDLSNEAFRYMTARDISIGNVPCLAARVTYVGELGWELYCPAEYGSGLWDLLWKAGAEHGMLACGYRAIDALRVEKGYRVWGADITPEDSPDEAGLGFAVKPDKGADFLGRDALLGARDGAPERRLACLVLADPRAVCLGQEPVRVAGEITGRVTSGGYGFAVGKSIAYAYVPAAAAEVGTAVEVEVFGDWVAAEVTAEPMWDPRGERIRG
jgi:4-methylaminobutanoate oxidase (formaldehyde-forming)